LIYFESGTISPRGGAQSWSGSTHGKGPSFILQLGIYSILFLDSRSTLLEYFSCYWCQGGRGPNSWVFSHPGGRKPIRGLFIWRVIPSPFSLRLHQWFGLGPIYTSSHFQSVWRPLAVGPNCWVYSAFQQGTTYPVWGLALQRAGISSCYSSIVAMWPLEACIFSS
jgi:hypothetical protein